MQREPERRAQLKEEGLETRAPRSQREQSGSVRGPARRSTESLIAVVDREAHTPVSAMCSVSCRYHHPSHRQWQGRHQWQPPGKSPAPKGERPNKPPFFPGCHAGLVRPNFKWFWSDKAALQGTVAHSSIPLEEDVTNEYNLGCQSCHFATCFI